MMYDQFSIVIYAIITIIIIWLIVYGKLKTNRESDCDNSVNSGNENFDCDVAIIGSGVLGSALAAVLGRDGRKVVVVEKNLEMPDRFSGEFLQPRGIAALRDLGLQECLKNIDAQNTFGCYIYQSQCENKIHFSFPLDSNGDGGLGLSNVSLVMSLRGAAMSEKNVTYIEGTVTNLLDTNQVVTGIIYQTKDDPEKKIVKAKLTIVADGCFSQFRKDLVNEKPEQLSSFVGGIIKDSQAFLSSHVHILFTIPNTLLFYQITSDSVRLLVDVKEKIPMKDMKNYLKETIYQQLPENFKDPFIKAITSTPFRSMPCNRMTALPIKKRGIIVLGDALNMRHPITGNGMTVAFCDIVILRKLLSDVKDLSDYKVLSVVSKQFHKLKRNHSFVINVYANFLHNICCASDEWTVMLQKAYISFINLNDEQSQSGMFLFSSLDTRIISLLRHLMFAGTYCAYFTFKENLSLFLFATIYKTVRITGRMFTTLTPSMWSEMKTFL